VKGVDALIASVLIILISITAIFLALQLGGQSTQKTKEILLMQEGKNMLISIGDAVKSVLNEGEGSTRVLKFSVTDGTYKIDNTTNSILFSMDSVGQIIAEGISKTEDGINFTGTPGIIFLNLSYDNIMVTGDAEFGRGYHTLTIRNDGYNETTEKQMIYISLTAPTSPTLVTFTNQYNQTQTLVLRGTTISNPNNLNDFGINTYDIKEDMEGGGQYSYSQSETESIKGINTSSAIYTNSLDSLNYNVTSTVGYIGGATLNQYNQTQTIVITGSNTTSPNNLNSIDSQTYNIAESGITVSKSNTSSDLESSQIQHTSTSQFITFFYEPSNSIDATTWDNTVDGDWVSSTTNACNGTSFRDVLTGLSNLKSRNTKVNTTGYYSIQANFTGYVNALDAGEYLRFYTYDGSSWLQQWNRQANLACVVQTFNLGSNYDNKPNFAMNFSCNHNAGANERCIVDDIKLSGYNIKTDENTSYINYNDISINNLYNTLTNITVIINVSYYNNTGSYGKNSNPDLWLEIWNGVSWIEIGNMSVTGIGNFSKSIQDSTILSAWNLQSNRDIRIKGRYFDTNRTAQDIINYTSVWVKIDSRQTTYRTEVEHNATGITLSGTLDNISVSVNFSTNVTSDFNLIIYNFNSGNWNYTTCQGGTATAGNWYNWWCNITDTPSYYNSSNGKIVVRLNETEHSGFAILREEYVQYYVSSTSQTTYANISVEHNSSMITENPSLITRINVTSVLKTNISSGIQFRFYIYNFSSESWNQCSQASVNNNYVKMECVIIAKSYEFISDSKIRVRLNSSGGTTTHQMMEDYLIYQVTLPNNYKMEVEHNATGITLSGTLDNISVSVNFSTNSTNSPTFDFLIYNFNSGSWETCDTLNPMVNNWNMRWCNKTANPGYYLSNGIIMSRLNETSHANLAEVKEDYIQYYVTFTQ